MPSNFTQWLIVFLVLVAIGGKDLVMAIARKLKWINGNKDNSEIFSILKNHSELLEGIGTNHLHSILEELKGVVKELNEQVAIHKEIIYLLQDIKNSLNKK
jgi:hypothetical protein